MTKVTVAAGTVTLRPRNGKEPQVLLVHRPSYDDWTLPKGKLEPDEYEAVAAGRETWEETGVRVALGHPLGDISYPVSSGRKIVHYWTARALDQKPRKPDKEVDKVVWLAPRAAMARMTYDDEKQTVLKAFALADTTPLLVVRHGKAMLRKHWSGRDQARPMTARGRKQSGALVPLFAAFDIRRLASSTSTRCVQTLRPYARKTGLEVEGWTVLSEEIGQDNPRGVTALVQRMAKEAAAGGIPTALCGHRPVLPTMLAALGIPPRPMQTAGVVIAHLDATGTAVAVEYHRPRA